MILFKPKKYPLSENINMGNKLTHSGNVIMAGFGIMLLLMSFLVYKCIMQRTDMVSADYYETQVIRVGYAYKF